MSAGTSRRKPEGQVFGDVACFIYRLFLKCQWLILLAAWRPFRVRTKGVYEHTVKKAVNG